MEPGRSHPDRIEILSFPGPDRSVRMEDIATGNIVSRRYRNRRIGEFLKELELTEGKATGIPRIKKAMRVNGSPEPVFDTDDDRTYFLAVLPVHEDFLAELPADTINVPVNVPANVPVNERQQWFLAQLSAGKQVRAADIAAHWDVAEKSAKRDIADLKECGAIEFIGAPKKGFYRIKS
jgi:ATP-dependent DNA helicase RecG